MPKSPGSGTGNQTPGRRGGRTPVYERGLVRQAALPDAAEQLLTTLRPEEVGIYQIAEQASVPPASVYHFFPNKDAAFSALVDRCIAAFRPLALEPAYASDLRSWQDYFRIIQERARCHLNAHASVLKLLYGGYGGLASHRADCRLDPALFEGVHPALDTLFHMPQMDQPARRFRVAFAAMDAVWALSYLSDGEITNDWFEDGLAAHNAYCELFLPQTVERRARVRQAAERGEMIALGAAPSSPETIAPTIAEA